MKRIQIFRAGQHRTMAGAHLGFTAADLAATAAAYNPDKYAAPLVLGHPATDAPAYGSVLALHAQGDRLYADISPVPDLVQKVREGRYLSVSAAFYEPWNGSSPSPGVWALRHVGFLGAQPPAVKGMERPAFGDAGGAVAFAQPLQWGAATTGEAVRYSEDPQGFHQVCVHLAGQAGISYAQAVRHMERQQDLHQTHPHNPSDAPAPHEAHRKIVAYMDSHPCVTYAQAFKRLLSQGELKGN